ncbi:MAG: alpha/beta-type small acid-soluble spore protein [Kyrpidia sp.]|nr:alpha/beta-type small acid-soluble spore protein [Kyrpidia sp.]
MDRGRRPDEAVRRQMMERMKWELARELGVSPPADGYWGGLPAKVCGQIGARLRHRAGVLMDAGSGRNRSGRKGPPAGDRGGPRRGRCT